MFDVPRRGKDYICKEKVCLLYLDGKKTTYVKRRCVCCTWTGKRLHMQREGVFAVPGREKDYICKKKVCLLYLDGEKTTYIKRRCVCCT